MDVFEPDDGEVGGGEAMCAGVLGRAGTPLRAFWSGRFSGIGAVGGGLLLRYGLLWERASFRMLTSESSFAPHTWQARGLESEIEAPRCLETGEIFWKNGVNGNGRDDEEGFSNASQSAPSFGWWTK